MNLYTIKAFSLEHEQYYNNIVTGKGEIQLHFPLKGDAFRFFLKQFHRHSTTCTLHKIVVS